MINQNKKSNESRGTFVGSPPAVPLPLTTSIEVSSKVNKFKWDLAICNAIKAVQEEPEFPDEMPQEMWEALCMDKEVATEAFRAAVSLTKRGIIERLKKLKRQ